MSLARDIADLAAVTSKLDTVGASSGALSNRNVIINGAMQVAQRSTSASGIGASGGFFAIDRWAYSTNNSAGRVTISQDSDAPEGFGYSQKIACTTADTSIAAGEYVILPQYIEGQNVQQFKKGTSSAEQITVSFYVKGNAAATYTVELEDAGNGRYNSQEFSVTSSWTRVTKTFVADTTGTITNDNGNRFRLNFWLHAGSSYTGGDHTDNVWHTTANKRVGDNATSIYDSTSRTFFITGVQLEVGDTATDFEHRSFADELQRCQRYYYIMDSSTSNGSYLRYCNAFYKSATAAEGVIHLPVEMRATPTLTASGTIAMYDGANLLTISTFVLGNDGSSNRIVVFDANNIASGGVQHRPGVFLSNANTTSKVELSSEL